MSKANRPNRPPESDSFFGAAILSAIFHAGALVSAFVVWPMIAPPLALPPDVLPVELVDIAQETNIAPQEQAEKPPEQPQETPPASSEPPPPPVAEEPPPPPPPEEDLALAEPEPTPPKEEVKPQPPQPKLALAKPRAKPKPEKKKDDFDIDAITGLVDKMEKERPKQQAKEPAPAAASRTLKGAGAQSALTMSEIDALKAQLSKCWNVPVGAPDPSALVVPIRFHLNQDGTLAGAPELLAQGRLGDPYFRAAADSAMRAVHICGPYQLPPDKYEDWREITINFDPREMAGY